MCSAWWSRDDYSKQDCECCCWPMLFFLDAPLLCVSRLCDAPLTFYHTRIFHDTLLIRNDILLLPHSFPFTRTQISAKLSLCYVQQDTAQIHEPPPIFCHPRYEISCKGQVNPAVHNLNTTHPSSVLGVNVFVNRFPFD